MFTDSILFIVLGLILGLGGAFVAWFLLARKGEKNSQTGAGNSSAEALVLLQNQLNTLIKTVD
ncbi:MAG: hypothetical protein WCZ69_01075, partial [Candidatus Paceibacterota bacterium]